MTPPPLFHTYTTHTHKKVDRNIKYFFRNMQTYPQNGSHPQLPEREFIMPLGQSQNMTQNSRRINVSPPGSFQPTK